MELFGAPAELLQQVKQEADERFIIHPDNWDTVQLFLDCATQWRHGGGMVGMKTGLDYTVLPVVAGIQGTRLDKPRFLDIRLMEAVALREFARRVKSRLGAGR